MGVAKLPVRDAGAPLEFATAVQKAVPAWGNPLEIRVKATADETRAVLNMSILIARSTNRLGT